MGTPIAWQYETLLATGWTVEQISTMRRRRIEEAMNREYESQQAERRGRRALCWALWLDWMHKRGHLTEWPTPRDRGPRSAA